MTTALDMAARYRRAAVAVPYAPIRTTGEHELLGESDLRLLDETFPSGLLVRGERDEHDTADKTYTVYARTLHDHGAWQVSPDAVEAPWSQLVTELVRPDYQRSLLTALGITSERVGRVEVRLAEYRAGGWMSRHTDRPDKIYSHLIYFCPGWRADWHGELTFYADQHARDPLISFLPGDGTTVAFARSDSSWHEVMPVAAHARRPRRTLLLHGYTS